MTLLRVTTVTMEPQEFFLCIELHVCVNNGEILSVGIDTQQMVPIALLLSYKIFRAIVNSIKVLRSLCKVPEIFI
jgi:hypothetical protein